MKKLLFLLAGAFLAITASAQSETKIAIQTAGSEIQTQESRIVERGVFGKRIGDYEYVFCILMHMEGSGAHGVTGVEPTGKVYREYGHTDVTDQVLRESKVTFDPNTGECKYSFTIVVNYETWSHEGSIHLI